MRDAAVLDALARRFLRPGRAGVLLLLGAAWAAGRLVLGGPYGRLGYGEALLPFFLVLGCLVLAPAAWQWGKGEAPLAGPLRGLLQSLGLNTLWVSGMLAGILALGGMEDPAPPHPPPPPPGAPGPGFGPGGPPPRRTPLRPPRPAIPPEAFHAFLGVLLATLVGRIVAEREAGEAREAELERLSGQARALALQAQMQPHALFNALSGLVELAQEDPEATEAALVALCDYLRRLMDHAGRREAPLAAERALLEDYLRVEQIRLGERLRVTWDWPAWVDGLAVPPLLLQPLVENAVLHGIAAATEGGELRLGAHRAGGTLVLKVENTGTAPKGDREGLGLGHLRERLRLLGPGAALELTREGDWTRARLTLPLPS
ncbi:MAG: histidine kinase [Holophagaceae bacterium]